MYYKMACVRVRVRAYPPFPTTPTRVENKSRWLCHRISYYWVITKISPSDISTSSAALSGCIIDTVQRSIFDTPMHWDLMNYNSVNQITIDLGRVLTLPLVNFRVKNIPLACGVELSLVIVYFT